MKSTPFAICKELGLFNRYTELPCPDEARRAQTQICVKACLKHLQEPYYDEVIFNLDELVSDAGAGLEEGLAILESYGWTYTQSKLLQTRLLHIRARPWLQPLINLAWFRDQCIQSMLLRKPNCHYFTVNLVYPSKIVTRKGLPPLKYFLVADEIVQRVCRQLELKGWWTEIICPSTVHRRYLRCSEIVSHST